MWTPLRVSDTDENGGGGKQGGSPAKGRSGKKQDKPYDDSDIPF